ncbi:Endoribonuclease L-PSP [Alloactinosynnema sp. L-07]|uniref:RidA family protein n=1 Tax=Alloactinosynnema sp. L-07 TaxID=1653480 RepID=UPI00065EF9F5|nr:Rid family hydrolase [Alloactinosynnema sp. L-07]CRK55106.1 Endoribonuclease L-PSP [Alloactinosynnema sp. L-07]
MTDPVYSMARIATGPTLFVAGQVPSTEDGSVPENAAAQTELVLSKIATILADHGIDWPAVVKLTYYLCDISDLTAVREVLRATLPHPRPTATLVEIGALIDPRFRVEIDAIADLGPTSG